MPQIFPGIALASPHVKWMMWEIKESTSFFQNIPEKWKKTLPPENAHAQKLLESLAARYCLWQLVKDVQTEPLELVKTASQRPYLKDSNYHISISHSFPFVSACISLHRPIGIDLERKDRKIQHIAPRFLSAKELDWAREDTQKLIAAWTVKEALYKAHQQAGLDFKNEISFDFEYPVRQGHVFREENTSYEVRQEEFPNFIVSLVLRN
ncbi:4'-phosphopantetheinyl transferase family protein [Aquirufa rosea]|uniref:4'-phosphopantetheinyl transferase superfamily protein n=1 Tax=Aquirufa rosea TaxID=2509241 RepID=A0A4Q1C2R0_9BACT|nr:4'-phosphopantetheinyl transferase superfamily protein [Aquirufa rosea]RXK52439.1 4'-phosphopantetheinyl transferase superfamily protein [Aquirufa rosea]